MQSVTLIVFFRYKKGLISIWFTAGGTVALCDSKIISSLRWCCARMPTLEVHQSIEIFAHLHKFSEVFHRVVRHTQRSDLRGRGGELSPLRKNVARTAPVGRGSGIAATGLMEWRGSPALLSAPSPTASMLRHVCPVPASGCSLTSGGGARRDHPRHAVRVHRTMRSSTQLT